MTQQTVIAILAVLVAYYAIVAHDAREHRRIKEERRDRRRDRLVALYSEWSSRLLDLLARKQQVDGVGTLSREKPEAISPSDALAMLDRVFLAQRELNRAAIAISLEEGEALASSVEELSRRAELWKGTEPNTINEDLERLLVAKRLSLGARGS